MFPLLTIGFEHVFRVFDGNVETLQSSVDSCDSGVGVVGLDTFDLVKKFFEVIHCCALVSDRDVELLDIGLLMIRELCSIRVGW